MRHLTIATVLLAMHPAAFADSPPRDDRPATIDEFMRVGGRTRVIAHRGFSGLAPENTLVALRRAIEVGADMVEIDVLLTHDGEVVLLHDDTLERTTNGEGVAAEVSLEEIRRLDAGSWFSPEFAGERVPLLAEALDLVRDRILINVEIKGSAVTAEAEGGIVDKVLRLVRERDMLDQVVISSFEPEALRQARQLDRAATGRAATGRAATGITVKTASLYDDKLHRGMGPLEVMAAVDSNGFNLSARRLSPEILDACHGAGRPVAVYTVNEEADMQRLMAAGVDAIFTDRPDRLLRLTSR